MKGEKTYSFGAGRENFSKTIVNRDNIGCEKTNPGPLHYSPTKPLGEEAVAFKFKFKIVNDMPDVLAKKWGYPGVGTYEDVVKFDTQGRYVSSQLPNAKSARWGKDDRLKPPGSTHYANPGPGTHNQKGDMSEGYQSLTQYHTIQTRSFGKEFRPF